MTPLAESFAALDYAVKPYAFEIEELMLRDPAVLSRILATDQTSKLDLPAFNRATMDGYAILADDLRDEYKLVGTVAAGESFTKKLHAGETIKIMTGAPVPEDVAKIVPVENAQAENNKIKIITWPKIPNIAWRGEDLVVGQKVLSRGTTIGAIEIANLIACGIAKVPVYKKLKIAIISTGDEIVDGIDNITFGKIMNSNGPMLKTLCEKQGFLVTMQNSISDDLAATTAIIKAATASADIVILSGGVSAGDFDYVGSALTQLKFQVHFNRLALKPGRPTTFASLANKYVFGLPGNPVAVYLTFYLFVLRAFRRMLGIAEPQQYFELPLAKNFSRRNFARTEYVPCTLNADGTLLEIDFHGSAHLAALLNCKGFFVVNQDVKTIAAGEKVRFLLLQL